MAKLLFDTDVIIEYLKGNQMMKEFLNMHSNDTLHVCAMTIAELFVGVRNDAEIQAINDFLLLFEVVKIDAEIAKQGGLFRKEYSKSHGVGLANSIIAASVMSIDGKLITLNKKHYPMITGIIVPHIKH